MSNAPWTVGRLLQWTTDFLKSHGSDSPRLDAEVLLAESLKCQRIQLYTRFDEEPSEEVRKTFRALVRRRSEGAPVAYLVGRREFYSLSFKVTPDVLIPRPETELLVVAVLDWAKAEEAGPSPALLRIADIGTGSGIVAVCLAKHLVGCRVTAVDISSAALAVARENAEKHGVAARIEWVESDLLTAVSDDRPFDVMVSNPPYITSAEFEGLASDVRQFEPKLALVAGPRGTEVIERLVVEAGERLRPGGYLAVEISPTIHDVVCELLRADDRFELGPTIKDLARLPRVVQARKKM
jgi:release factor glutamine methyltransferase